MTPEKDIYTRDMHALVLQFLGCFSAVQDWIDHMIARSFFQNWMPRAADVVWKRTVYRIKDEERVALLLAIAEEIETDAALGSFKTVYMEAKRLRDRLAHTSLFQPDGIDRLQIHTTLVGHEDAPAPTEIHRVRVLNAIWYCNWLEAQLLYITSSEKLSTGINLVEAPVEVLKPPERPEDWDGERFRRLPAE